MPRATGTDLPAPGSQYVFAADLVDEGAENVARRNKELGLTALSLATAYHESRDVVPHGGDKPRVRYRKDGAYFEPTASIWGDARIQPRIQPEHERRAVAQLLEHSELPVEAWLVILHNTELGERYPEVNGVTCFGDRLIAHLCPSQPAAAEYAVNLAREVSGMGMDVIAEGLNFQPFPHGHHHERTFTPIGLGPEFVQSLCFCDACTTSANEAGIDMERLRRASCELIDAAFDGDDVPLTIEALTERLGDDLPRLLEVRNRTVTDLARRLGEAARANGRTFSYMDLMGSVMSYDHGVPVGPPAAEGSWRLGMDIAALAEVSDSITMLAYSADADRVEADVASYVALVGDKPVRAILRPGHPDTHSTEHLRDKVRAAGRAGAAQVDFYNYGMYTQKVLDRIPASFS